MNELLKSEQLWWFVARSSGIVAMVLAALSVIWGLLVSTRVMQGTPSPKWLLAMHRWLGGLTVSFSAVHLVGLVADSYVEFSWLEILVPFASSWKPLPVALGVVTMYLLVAVQATSLAMKRIPRRWWKLIHLSSYGLFWTGLVHGATAGTDAGTSWYVVGSLTLTLLVLFLTVYRVLAGKTKRKITVPSSASSAGSPSAPTVRTP